MDNAKRITRIIDVASQKFGRLTAISIHGVSNKKVKWNCVCECGAETIVDSYALRNGKTRSCGCLAKEASSVNMVKKLSAASLKNTTHGYAKKGNIHPLWYVWYSMKQRCNTEGSSSYEFYGKRGISVCCEWEDSGLFIEWALNNGWSKGMQIDRIDVNGDYCPENCRFITQAENALNKTNSAMVMYQDNWITITELSRLSGIELSKLHYRLKHGWSIEDALSTKRIRHYHKRPTNVESSIISKKHILAENPDQIGVKESTKDTGEDKPAVKDRSVTDDPKNY